MRDWEALTRERLGDLGLGAETQRDVVREVAGHFAEIYEHEVATGASDEDAYARALASVTDWEQFRRDLCRAKEDPMTMEPWKRRVGIPGVATLALAAITFMVTRFLPVSHAMSRLLPGTIYIKGTFFHFDVPWMLTLPFAGALGTLLARRHGANLGERALAALFPSLFWVAAIMSMAMPVLLQNMLGAHFFEAPPTAQVMVMIGIPLVVGSAVASLFGAALVGATGTDRETKSHA